MESTAVIKSIELVARGLELLGAGVIATLRSSSRSFPTSLLRGPINRLAQFWMKP
jgi:hypothetical protein